MKDEENLLGRRSPRKLGRKKPASLPVATEKGVCGTPNTPQTEPPTNGAKPTVAANRRAKPDCQPATKPKPKTDLLDLRPDSPFRPPDFRWQIAVLLARGVAIPPEWIDRWVLLGEDVLTAPAGGAIAATDLLAVVAARELAERRSGWGRIEVEARLLADQPVSVIAAKTGRTVAAVEAYEAMFYAVADRLRHRSYVVHQVIGLHAPGAETDVGIQLRMLGYRGGTHVINAVLDAATSPAPASAQVGSDDARRLRKLARLAVELRTTPVTEANIVKWAGLFALLRECSQAGVGPG